ncbi:MAG: hypothetical protein JRG76_08755 [Deltaproteobacteria bacterium]|nr:hypothetical protein [Deltaproteobacteria bacterium]
MAAAHDQGELGFDPGELWAVLGRRFWWLAIPSALGLLISGVLALVWPAEYESAAIVMVQPQDIPAHLVLPTVGTDTEAAFNSIRLRILARDRLSQIIDDLKLYPEMTEDKEPREAIIRHMRTFISIDPLPPAVVDPRKPVQIESFRIAFRDRNATTARDVASRLTQDFRAVNLDQRAGQAEGTSEFILAELQRARQEQERVGIELSEYKEQHRGELPEDMPINQQRLARLTSEIGQQQAVYKTSVGQVDRLKVELDELRATGSDSSFDPARRKQAAELELRQHRALGKTEKHPDVLITRKEIAQLEVMIAEAADDDTRPASYQENSLVRELRTHEVRVGVMQSEVARIRKEINMYEDRIIVTPRRGAEIGHLEAQYVSLTQAIWELQSKRVAADMGRAIELAQKGEKFQVVEAAVIPEEPISPNRPLFVLVGVAVGLLGGLSLLAARELADESFHTVRDLQGTLGLPVLGTIPSIDVVEGGSRNGNGVRRWIGTGLVVLALGGGALYAGAAGLDSEPVAASEESRV